MSSAFDGLVYYCNCARAFNKLDSLTLDNPVAPSIKALSIRIWNGEERENNLGEDEREDGVMVMSDSMAFKILDSMPAQQLHNFDCKAIPKNFSEPMATLAI
ncbi:hypothetical protein BGX24_008740, partial [Mortierella sp. AD032]